MAPPSARLRASSTRYGQPTGQRPTGATLTESAEIQCKKCEEKSGRPHWPDSFPDAAQRETVRRIRTLAACNPGSQRTTSCCAAPKRAGWIACVRGRSRACRAGQHDDAGADGHPAEQVGDIVVGQPDAALRTRRCRWSTAGWCRGCDRPYCREGIARAPAGCSQGYQRPRWSSSTRPTMSMSMRPACPVLFSSCRVFRIWW